jgi:hypothetical protein
LIGRPFEPLHVGGHDVEEDIGIEHESHQSSPLVNFIILAVVVLPFATPVAWRSQ